MLADATGAYNRNSRGTAGVSVEHARRHAIFIHPADELPAYVILADDLRKDAKKHGFTWLMHVSDRLAIDTLPDRCPTECRRSFRTCFCRDPLVRTGPRPVPLEHRDREAR